MSAISLKSITGITSITTPAGVDNVFTVHTNDTTERFRIDQTGNQNIVGIVTVTKDLDVDGHTNLDNVSIAGVTTFANNIVGTNAIFSGDINNSPAGGGSISGFGAITIQAPTPALNFTETDANPDYRIIVLGGQFRIQDVTNSYANRFIINTDGTTSIEKNLNCLSDLDVDGHTNLDNVSIAGVTTAAGSIVQTSGHTQLRSFSNPTSGAGMEMGYDGTRGVIQCYDRDNSGNKSLFIGGGNVGINQVSPTAKLDVNGGFKVAGAIDANGDLDVDGHTNLDNVSIAGVTTATGAMDVNNILTVTRSGSNTAAIFSGGGGAGNIQIKDGNTGTLAFISVVGGVLHFQTSGNSYSKKLTIKPDGNVGIGSDAPTERFVVQGAGVSNLTYDIDGGGFDSTSGGALVLTGVFDYSGSKLGMMVDNAGQGRIFTKTAQALHFGQSNQKDMTIAASSGNVGINEDNPSDKLVVNGTTNFKSNSYIGGDLYMYGSSYTKGIFLGGSGSDNKLDYYEEGTFNPTYGGTHSGLSGNHRHARYTRIGNMVFISMEYYNSSNNASWSNGMWIGNMPFNSSLNELYCAPAIGVMYGPNGYDMDSNATGRCYHLGSQNRIYFKFGTSGVRHLWIMFHHRIEN